MTSKCSFTPCKLRFFGHFRLDLDAALKFCRGLSYVISNKISDDAIKGFIENSRIELEQFSQRKINRGDWLKGMQYSMYDYRVNRMACQLTLHITLRRTDIERVYKSSKRLLQLINQLIAG